MGLYQSVWRPLLFRLDAERAHHLALAAAGVAAPFAGTLRRLLAVDDPRLATRIAGLDFPNPLGLAAGFDKSGTGIATLAGLGFGAVGLGDRQRGVYGKSVSVREDLGGGRYIQKNKRK